MTDPTTHPRLAPILAGILENPDDDGARLAFADALEEFGDNDDQFRAEFIRVQVELARLIDLPLDPRTLGGGPALRRRERGLLSEGRDYEWFFPRGVIAGECRWEFRRGFVERLTCHAADCLLRLDEALKRQPVRHVTLTTWEGADGDVAIRRWAEKNPGLDGPGERTWRQVLGGEDGLWPGVEFTLPNEMGVINSLLDQIRNQAAHVVGDGNVQVGPMGGYADVNEYGAPRRPGRPFLGDYP